MADDLHTLSAPYALDALPPDEVPTVPNMPSPFDEPNSGGTAEKFQAFVQEHAQEAAFAGGMAAGEFVPGAVEVLPAVEGEVGQLLPLLPLVLFAL